MIPHFSFFSPSRGFSSHNLVFRPVILRLLSCTPSICADLIDLFWLPLPDFFLSLPHKSFFGHPPHFLHCGLLSRFWPVVHGTISRFFFFPARSVVSPPPSPVVGIFPPFFPPLGHGLFPCPFIAGQKCAELLAFPFPLQVVFFCFLSTFQACDLGLPSLLSSFPFFTSERYDVCFVASCRQESTSFSFPRISIHLAGGDSSFSLFSNLPSLVEEKSW